MLNVLENGLARPVTKGLPVASVAVVPVTTKLRTAAGSFWLDTSNGEPLGCTATLIHSPVPSAIGLKGREVRAPVVRSIE